MKLKWKFTPKNFHSYKNFKKTLRIILFEDYYILTSNFYFFQITVDLITFFGMF